MWLNPRNILLSYQLTPPGNCREVLVLNCVSLCPPQHYRTGTVSYSTHYPLQGRRALKPKKRGLLPQASWEAVLFLASPFGWQVYRQGNQQPLSHSLKKSSQFLKSVKLLQGLGGFFTTLQACLSLISPTTSFLDESFSPLLLLFILRGYGSPCSLAWLASAQLAVLCPGGPHNPPIEPFP